MCCGVWRRLRELKGRGDPAFFVVERRRGSQDSSPAMTAEWAVKDGGRRFTFAAVFCPTGFEYLKPRWWGAKVHPTLLDEEDGHFDNLHAE